MRVCASCGNPIPHIRTGRVFCGRACGYAGRSMDHTNPWSEQEDVRIKAYYTETDRLDFDLDDLAGLIGRSKAAVAIRASRLGFTIPRSESSKLKSSKARDAISKAATSPERAAKLAAMLTPEFLKFRGERIKQAQMAMSPERKMEAVEKMKAAWSRKTIDERANITLRKMKTRLARYGTLCVNQHNGKRSWKAAWHTIGDKRHFFRSSWEVKYAGKLQMLKAGGAIAEWEYEAETFWFDKIKRGCRSYTPDFKVTNNDGSVEFHEVKGWMDNRSKTKIKRMDKYHPEVKLIVITKV